MNRWPVQDAKARFSELLAICAAEGLEPDNWRHRTAEARKFINVWNALAALEADLFKTASDAALDGVKNGGKGGKT